jgi:stage V sporulation protein B
MPIFYSALMLTGVNLLLRFTGTSFQIYISNRIGPAGVGLLQLVMSVGMLAMVAGMAGIRTTSMYLTAEQLGKKQSGAVTWVLSSCFGYSIICSGVISAILYVFAPYLAEYWVGDIRTLGAIRLYAAFLPVSCLCGVMTGYFTAANRISALAAVEVAEQTISMVSTFLILSLWSGTDPARACQGVILGSGIGGCITLVALCVLRLRERTSAGPKTPIIRRLLGCAIPLAVADVTKAGISTTENLMVPKRLSRYPVVENPLAAFGMVCGMVFPLIMFPAAILFSLAELLLPELARCKAAGSTERIRYLVQRSLRSTMIYGFFFCAIMFRLADFLSLQLYDNSEVGIHLQRYSLLIPILYCDAITDAMTKGLGQQKACVRYNIVTSALDVVLLFWLLPRYGMDGYFFSFLVTHGLNFFLSLRRLLRISQVEIHFSKPVAAAAATALSIWFSSLVHQPIVSAAACLIIQLCLFFLLKVINREDIGWIQKLVKGK